MSLLFPIVTVIILVGVLSHTALRIIKLGYRIRHGRCFYCGYEANLSFSGCPECGRPHNANRSFVKSILTDKKITLGILCAIMLGLLLAGTVFSANILRACPNRILVLAYSTYSPAREELRMRQQIGQLDLETLRFVIRQQIAEMTFVESSPLASDTAVTKIRIKWPNGWRAHSYNVVVDVAYRSRLVARFRPWIGVGFFDDLNQITQTTDSYVFEIPSNELKSASVLISARLADAQPHSVFPADDLTNGCVLLAEMTRTIR